jgi:hypothetical protein
MFGHDIPLGGNSKCDHRAWRDRSTQAKARVLRADCIRRCCIRSGNPLPDSPRAGYHPAGTGDVWAVDGPGRFRRAPEATCLPGIGTSPGPRLRGCSESILASSLDGRCLWWRRALGRAGGTPCGLGRSGDKQGEFPHDPNTEHLCHQCRRHAIPGDMLGCGCFRARGPDVLSPRDVPLGSPHPLYRHSLPASCGHMEAVANDLRVVGPCRQAASARRPRRP